jgi:predicted transcriptional regulator
MDPNLIREKFLVNEARIAEKALKNLEGRVSFDDTGEVLVNDADQYKDRDRIALYLAGRKLAFLAQAAKEDGASGSEVAEKLGMDPKVVGARLSDLRKDAIVEQLNRGVYRVRLARVAALFPGQEARLNGA